MTLLCLALKIVTMGNLGKIKSSIYNPDFYSKIKQQGLGTALKYFFLFILLLTVVNTLILSYELGIKAPQEIKSFVNQSIMSFPSDLQIGVEDGQVTTNAQEPFFVPFPQLDYETEYGDLNNILVIDTKTPFSAAQFDQYKTMFWLSKDSLFYQNREYDQRSIALTEFDNIKIDRPFVQSLADKADPWLNWIGPGLILLTFLGLFLGFSFNLTYFLFLAVLIFFLSSIFKWGLSYSASYKTAIYSSTLAFIVDLIIFNTGLYTGFFGFPLLFTLTALCISTINLQNFQEKS